MTSQQIVAVAVRLFAIWFGFNGMTSVALQMSSWMKNGYPAWELIAAAVVFFLVCTFMWRFPLTIANTLVPREPVSIDTPRTVQSLVRVAIAMRRWSVGSK